MPYLLVIRSPPQLSGVTEKYPALVMAASRSSLTIASSYLDSSDNQNKADAANKKLILVPWHY